MTNVDLDEEIFARSDELERILDDVSQIDFDIKELLKKKAHLTKQFDNIRTQIDLFKGLKQSIQEGINISTYV